MLGIVHISDIHLKNSPNLVLDRVSQIKGAVQSECYDVDDLLLLISGDFVFSGKPQEYSVAIEFVAELEKAFRAISNMKLLGTVSTPGNHDCNFANEGEVRPVLLSSIAEHIDTVEPSGEFVQQMLKVQEDFFAFEERLSNRSLLRTQRLAWHYEFESSVGKVLVRSFNTAWCSRLKEVYGQLYFPPQAVPDITATDANLVVTVFHHPYGWMQPDNGRQFRRLMETTSDVVFTGHEHDAEVYSKISGTGASVNYVAGAALQAAEIATGFNFVKVDVRAQTYQVRQFEWANNMYAPGSAGASMFTRNQALLDHQFVNNTQFRAELDDVGTPFSHPAKTTLALADLFIYPDVKVTTIGSKVGGVDTVVRSADAFEYIASITRLCIAGAPSSGKTSLAKTLYGDLQLRKKFVPVILRPKDIRGSSSAQVHAAVERAVERQYSKRLLDRFNQLDPDSKVVLVDDWHKTVASAKAKAEILKALEKAFGKVILFTDDATIFRQISEAVSAGALSEYQCCEIKQVGYRLRGELVGKWVCLGREFDTEELALTHKIAESEYLLDTLIGKGIVPSFPFFIFSVLQAEDPSISSATFGAYGHIYHALLTARLARIDSKTVGQKFKFLSLLAAKVLETGSDALSMAQVRSAHQKYETEYMVRVNIDQILSELEDAQLLGVSEDTVRFKYRYAYYYSAAEFLHDGISNVKDAEALRQKLKDLADGAHNDENAHIVTFYLYMSKDRLLIEHILANAAKLFSDSGPSDLRSDVEFVNVLYSDTPKLEAPSTDTDKNREEHRDKRDQAEDEQSDEELSNTPDSLRIDFGIQSMNIMGQVLRNFPNDLRADLKLRLTEESYQLGLRMLHAFLGFLQANVDLFRRDMAAYFNLVKPSTTRTDEELQAIADRLLISLTELVIFGSIKKISMSVGVDELKDTYDVVRENAGEDHVPTRIIDLAIKLDHFARIPESDVEDLKARLRGNPAVYTAVRLLVGEFLYLFPVDYKVRQRMIKLLDFRPGASTLSEGKRVKKLKMGSE